MTWYKICVGKVIWATSQGEEAPILEAIAKTTVAKDEDVHAEEQVLMLVNWRDGEVVNLLSIESWVSYQARN